MNVNKLVNDQINNAYLNEVKDYLNTATLVLTFVCPPAAVVTSLASGTISVIQGNYVEAAFTFVCTIPMIRLGPAAREAESLAAREVGSMLQEGETYTSKVIAEGLVEKEAGKVLPELEAACEGGMGCFVAGTEVVMADAPEDEAAPAERVREVEARSSLR